MEPIIVEVQRIGRTDDLPLPQYMSDDASGMDLAAAVERMVTIRPGAIALIPTGIAVAIPGGHEGQVRSRSGMAARSGVFVLNSPGTIDADYRGEVRVILANLGAEPFDVRRGDRIAQLVIAPVCRARWIESNTLEQTTRQAGGFGHTGGHSTE